MSNLNGYPERCESCGERRTCDGSGLCQECKFSVSGKVKAERDELLIRLKELVAISGEANIPMVNAHSVRKMEKFLDEVLIVLLLMCL